MKQTRGQLEVGLYLFITLILFALIGYSLLPTFANAQRASEGTNETQVSNLSSAGQAINDFGPAMFAIAILLAITSGGIALYGLFGR